MCCFLLSPHCSSFLLLSKKYIVLKVKSVYGAGVCQCLGAHKTQLEECIFQVCLMCLAFGEDLR